MKPSQSLWHCNWAFAPKSKRLPREKRERNGSAQVRHLVERLQRKLGVRVELKDKGGFGYPANQTPWQELYRSTVGQQATGACMELATRYQNIAGTVGVARDNH